MKSILFLNGFMLLICSISIFLSQRAVAQAPQSFNYQAVVRNSNGDIVTGQPVSFQMSVIYGSPTGTVLYSETHAITTNSFGMANLPVGAGNVVSGNLASIDWSLGPHYLKVEADTTGGSSYTEMGTVQLMSVPYALYAAHTGSGGSSLWDVSGNNIFNTNSGYVGVGTNTPPAKMVVQGDSSMSDTVPLFEVKDRTGHTVFIVYPDSVRIYVGDDGTKANKGAFAVSGRNTAKQMTHNYFLVQPDSTRVYTGSGGSGFAVKNLDVAGSQSYMFLTPENYFIGHNAGNSNTTGLYNTFIGFKSGLENTLGNDNIFLGYEAGYSNNAGDENIFIGNNAGYSNLDAWSNTFIGYMAGYSNTIGEYNVFMGNMSGLMNTIGDNNVFIGNGAGQENVSGHYNVFIGNTAGESNLSGESNVMIGDGAGENNESGSSNIFIGDWSGYGNFNGQDNLFLGAEAGFSNVGGSFNLFLGSTSGYSNLNGMGNVFLGDMAGYSNTIGNDNIFIGSETGNSNLTGSFNVFLGTNAGELSITGSDNIYIGQDAGANNEDGIGNVIIGSNSANGLNSGDNNVVIGLEAGFECLNCDSNIFIGNKAGYYENGSNKLYIDNSETDKPLIHGDFIDDKVTINDILNIAPRSSAPLNPVNGDVYINSTDNHVYCYLNGVWKQLDN